MATFCWDARFETGFGEVDAQHRHLVGLLATFSARLEQAADVTPASLAPLHGELLAYAREHFETEERLIREAGLDQRHALQHEREHADFARQVEAMVARPAGGEDDAPRRLHAFLVHWLTYHILGSDQSMARQLRAVAGGCSPAEAYAEAERGVDAATATLLRSVQALFDVLSDRNRELTQLAASLESRVAERTEALTAANAELTALVARVEQMAMTDSLTGLANRRRAMEELARAWALAERSGRPLSCLVLDADGFKQVNDAHGHAAGDVVLQALAAALRDGVRAADLVARLGGDEFLVIAPDTPLEGALALGERLRARVSRLRVAAGGGVWPGSISVGAAAREPGTTDLEALLRAADQGVYAAKRAGRNAVRGVRGEVPAEPRVAAVASVATG